MREAMVKYTRANSLSEFLNAVSVELTKKTCEGYPSRFEIIYGDNSVWKLEGEGDVCVLVIGPGNEVEQIYGCSYRGLFSGSIFEANSERRKFYEEFHKWVNNGKLDQLLTMYFSGTADATLEIVLSHIETALSSLAKEGGLLLGNLDLIGKTRQDMEYAIEEVSKFASEERFVELANAVRENIIRAKLCMFCKVLSERVVRIESGGEDA